MVSGLKVAIRWIITVEVEHSWKDWKWDLRRILSNLPCVALREHVVTSGKDKCMYACSKNQELTPTPNFYEKHVVITFLNY